MAKKYQNQLKILLKIRRDPLQLVGVGVLLLLNNNNLKKNLTNNPQLDNSKELYNNNSQNLSQEELLKNW